jgi:hypothetical protein
MNFSYSDNEGIGKQWNVSDSFKVTKQKLRVVSREEVRKRQEESKNPANANTCDAKSYLKSRRQKARDERRQNVMGFLDDNLDRLETASSPEKRNNKNLLDNPAKPARNFMSSPSTSGPKSILKEEKSQVRLRALYPFRQKSKCNGSDKRDFLTRTKSGRRAALRRKEQKEAIESVTQTNGMKSEMQEILEEVLRKYPKERCKTFADHKEFAFAELTIQSNKVKEFLMDAKKFKDLKDLLESQLSITLREDNSVAESARIDENLHHPNCQSRYQDYYRDACCSSSLTARTAVTPSLSKSSICDYQRTITSRISPRTSPRTETVRSSPETGQNRKRSVVPSPPLSTSPLKSSPKISGKSASGTPSIRPNSSQSLQLPSPRSSSMRLAPFIEKDDLTTTTENDDESTLVPVVKLVLVDPNGQVGNYTGTIDVNTGLPQGSGRLEYEACGTYQGDFNQGIWSGYGRHVKRNGDIYEGNYFDNVKHGIGVYRYRDGNRVFEGRYVLGQRVDGKMTYGDGSAYKGQWYDGKRHGRGTYRFKDGSVYKGEFVADMIHGVGQLSWPDGAKYIGEWSNGHRHGFGKEFTKDGNLRYEGKWKDSIPIS